MTTSGSDCVFEKWPNLTEVLILIFTRTIVKLSMIRNRVPFCVFAPRLLRHRKGPGAFCLVWRQSQSHCHTVVPRPDKPCAKSSKPTFFRMGTVVYIESTRTVLSVYKKCTYCTACNLERCNPSNHQSLQCCEYTILFDGANDSTGALYCGPCGTPTVYTCSQRRV